MMENKKLLPIAILILAASLLFASVWTGYSLQKALAPEAPDTEPAAGDGSVFNLAQAAAYLNLTEGEVLGIIETEEAQLHEYGGFSGKMFPYFTVNDKQYFYRDEIDEWLKEVSGLRRQYNTAEGWIF